ncbi:MAG TPA: hemerythrin domain-containing protein [Thermoplasmata archaeon]|nr:hemerythrin domain-containing protein [Thermoplasmata archaeon]
MDPLLTFHREHEALRPRLRAFEGALDVAMNREQAGSAELTVFRETLTFLRAELERHMRREEHALLPALEAKIGRRGTLVSVIAYDHEEIRRALGKLGEALAALEGQAATAHALALREVNRHGIFLVQYLGLHMAKEDSALMAVARESLGEEGLREVERRLESMG